MNFYLPTSPRLSHKGLNFNCQNVHEYSDCVVSRIESRRVKSFFFAAFCEFKFNCHYHDYGNKYNSKVERDEFDLVAPRLEGGVETN